MEQGPKKSNRNEHVRKHHSMEPWMVVLAIKELELKEEDIQGKSILDVGGGTGELAVWLNEHGARAVTIDRRLFTQEEGRADVPTVVGDAQQLPFSDEAFDLAISHAAVPNVIRTSEKGSGREHAIDANSSAIVRSLRELVRVVKQEGEVRLVPVIMSAETSSGQTIQAQSIQRAISILEKDPDIETKIDLLEKEEWDGIEVQSALVILRRKAKA